MDDENGKFITVEGGKRRKIGQLNSDNAEVKNRYLNVASQVQRELLLTV